MTPDQQFASESIVGLVYRTAMEIAELPEDQRGSALQMARISFAQMIADQDVAEPELVEAWTDGIAAVLREIEASGNPSGGACIERASIFGALIMANALVIRRNTQLTKDQGMLRAAQYVRMSTDYQHYSTENQAATIAAYAARHNLKIIRTYADDGRSGLRISNRRALVEPINDIRFGKRWKANH